MRKTTFLFQLLPTLLFTLFFSIQAIATPKIVFWSTQQHNEYLDKIITNFEKKYQVEIELQQFLAEDLRDEVVTLSRTAELPDMLYIPSDFVGMHKEIKLSPIPEIWFSQELSPKVRSISKIANVNYGVPVFQGNHLMLFYNRDLITKPMTDWQELKAQAQTLKNKVNYPIGWHYREMYWLVPFMSAYQAWPLEGNEITLNTPEMVKALYFYQGLAQEGMVDVNCDHDCSVDRFKNGQTAYLINGDWIIRSLEETMGDKLGIAILPKVEGQTMYPMFGSYVLAFPNLQKDSEKYKILEKFALYLQEDDVQQLILDEAGLMPINDKVLAESYIHMDDNMKAVMAQVNLTRPLPTSPNMSTAWFSMKRGAERLIDHNYSPEKAAKFMQRTADKEIKRQKNMAN